MALHIASQVPSLCIRRQAYEQCGLTREEIDIKLGLTPDEFRVEEDLIVIGPIHGASLDEFFRELETLGLRYYDDYFELSGNWPDWLRLYATTA